MTSAFQPTLHGSFKASFLLETPQEILCTPREPDTGETEDEEVKINCMHGADRYYDLSFADSSDESGSDDDEWTEGRVGVVHFVSGRVQDSIIGLEIYRPKPIYGGRVIDSTLNDASKIVQDERHIKETIATLYDDYSQCDGDESSIGDEESIDDQDQPRLNAKRDQVVVDDFAASAEDVEYDDVPTSLLDLLHESVTDNPEDEKLPSLKDELHLTNGFVILKLQQETVERRISKRPFSRTVYDYPVESWSSISTPKRIRSDDSPTFFRPLLVDPAVSPCVHLRVQGSTVSASDDDCDELDQCLSEELNPHTRLLSRENTPVPLLTPPGSPVMIDVGAGATTTICEWPSNLAVDSALTAVSSLRPLSPESLQQLERDEEKRVFSFSGFGLSKVTEVSPMTSLFHAGIGCLAR